MKPLGTAIAALLIGSAIHLDWHLARPAHHHLSLGWPWHWTLAIPVFALAAWYVVRSRPSRPVAASVTLLAAAILLGAVVEPVWEYYLGGATSDWAFGPLRTRFAIVFILVGIAAYMAVFLLLRRRSTLGKDLEPQ